MVEAGGPASADGDLERLVGGQRRAFAARFGAPPAFVASAPGRINVIGEHTDYNLGLALPGAIDRWIVTALSPRPDDVVRVHSEAFDETIEWCGSGTDPVAQPISGGRGAGRAAAPAGGGEGAAWGCIPGAALELMDAVRGSVTGCDVLIGGNVPRGAGVSSSAAVEMALLNALRAAFDVGLDDLALVRMAQRIEHDYLGVATGLMDQYTAQFARAGALMLVDFESVTHQAVPVRLDEWVWLLLDSGVRHQLAATAYGERVAQMRTALALIARADPSVASFRDLGERHAAAIEDAMLRRRLRHYVLENDRVRAAAVAVAAGDAIALGALMLASHASLRDDYQVSCAELDVLVDAAVQADGCAGARMMGGGFGGCTVNVVRAGASAELVATVTPAFERRFGRAPGAAVYRLAGGAVCHPPARD